MNFWQLIYSIPMKPHTKEEVQLSGRSWEINVLCEKLTDDRRTTDKSALEKLRCHSAGGAKKRYIWSLQYTSYPTNSKTNFVIHNIYIYLCSFASDTIYIEIVFK